MVRRAGWLSAGLSCLLAAILFGAAVGYEEWNEAHEAAQPLVVIARDGIQLSRGNWSAPPPRFETPLNRGVEARLLFERDRWLQIELAGGEVGWVPAGVVVMDR